ncbi:MAG: hypothetical protein CEE43_18860 [Promethearchaeota archaeon Loki_b32]|nr:MAG: hypothetical protein CEE43_18860 [Candidatus Lokiarchaeota archaeon Loki_b32]
MKLPQNKKNLTYGNDTIDINEALTKFSNLLILFPYHPQKSKIENIGWLTPKKFLSKSDIPKKPFCNLIEICHRKGFSVFKDWLSYIENKSLNKREIVEIRKKLVNHLNELTKNIDYKEESDRLILNNQFKELNIWIKKMYDKINYLKNKGGWSSAFLKQLRRRKEIGDAYKQYREVKAKKRIKKIEQYNQRRKELMNEDKFEFNLYKLFPMSYTGYKIERKLPKNPSEKEILKSKLLRLEYNSHVANSLYNEELPLELEFTKIFHFKHNLKEFNILTPQEFDNSINEILQLMGHNWVSCINGELMLIGYSTEEKEEKEVFIYLKEHQKVIENLEKAKQHIMEADWNSVPLYCCKAIEHFYKDILGQKNVFEKYSISQLTQKLIKDINTNSLFKNSPIGINDGIKYLLLSGVNLIGTLRNRKDSAHANLLDVEDWEAKLGYSYTILLLKSLMIIKI